MDIQLAENVGDTGINLAYESLGDERAIPVVLIMGAGGQLIHWRMSFCLQLIARGLRVIRFDNRDSGLSTHLSDAPEPDIMAAVGGDTSSASYTLSNMAEDTIGLLDHLGIKNAHFVGASLGGAVAQTVAIEHVGRIRSLTSIMSSTGNPTVGQMAPEAMRVLGAATPKTREEAIEQAVAAYKVMCSPGFETDEADARQQSAEAYDRSFDPKGRLRQALAGIASGDRTAQLQSLSIPTLVIHGANDKIVDVSGGRATAGAIDGANLVAIEGMGHELPAPLWPRIVELIGDHVLCAEGALRR